MKTTHQPDLEELLARVTEEAKANHGGHFTILSFTTHVKCAFGTPDLDYGDGREEVALLPPHTSLRDALVDLLQTKRALR